MKEEKIPDFDLTPIAEDWFVNQFDGFVQGEEKRITHFEFDVRAFLRFVIRFVLDYQFKRQWGTVTIITSKMLHYDDRSIRKFRKSKR